MDRCPRCSGTGFELKRRDDGVLGAVTCACAAAARGERLLRTAGIPRRYEHCTLDSFEIQSESHAAARRMALEWVERWPLVDHGLLFLGQPGTGKTHLAVGIARDIIGSKGARVVFREQRELLKEVQATFDTGSQRTETDVMRRVAECDVLVLDDLGAGRTTAWARDVLHDLIVQRYNERRVLILTSNHATGESDAAAGRDAAGPLEALTLRHRLGDALMSRLYEMCRVVEVEGRDYRRGVLHARFHY
jgi:DNA replication protein DnaC